MIQRQAASTATHRAPSSPAMSPCNAASCATASSSSSVANSQGFSMMNSSETCRTQEASSTNTLTNIPFSIAQRSMQFVQYKNESFKKESMKSTITKQRKTKDLQVHAGVFAFDSRRTTSSAGTSAPTTKSNAPSSAPSLLDVTYRTPFTLLQLNEDYKKRLLPQKQASSSVLEFLRTKLDSSSLLNTESIIMMDDDICKQSDSFFPSSTSHSPQTTSQSHQSSNSLVNYQSTNTKCNEIELSTSSTGIILQDDNDDDYFPLQRLRRLVKNHEEQFENKNKKQEKKEDKDNKLYISIEQSLPAMINVFTLDNRHLLDSSIVFSIQNLSQRQSFVIDPRFNIPSVKRGEKFVLNVHNRHTKPVRFCIMFRDSSGVHVSIYPKQLKILQSLENDLEYLPSNEVTSQVFDSALLPHINEKKTSCKVSMILMATTHVKFKNAITEICSRIQGKEKNQNNLIASITDRDKRHHHPLLESSSSFKRVTLKSIDLMIRIE